jgi:hypothetical protein
MILCPRVRAPSWRGVKRMVSERGLKPWGEILEGIVENEMFESQLRG